jgi:hypothetical protein
MARSHQNQCCVLVWGSFIGCHCREVLKLHRALTLPLLLKLAEILDLRLAEFYELFIELQHCFSPLSDKITVQGPSAQGFDCLSNDMII